MQFQAEAEVGNANGVFDAAYNFGDGQVESEMTGTPEQIGQAITRYLSALQAEDCEAMRYGTQDFFVRLTVRPVKID